MVKWRSLLLGGVISAVCLALLLQQVDLGKTWESFRQADPVWLGLSLVSMAVALWLRCWRWQFLFLPKDRVSLRGTTSATLIGYMFNTVLPGRVGELVRASLVGQTEQVSTARAIGTIFIEKILDVLVLLVLLGALVPVLPLPAEITGAGVKASVAFGALAVAFFAASYFRDPLVSWAERRLDHLPLLERLRPSRVLHLVLDAADGLRRPDLLALQIVLSTVLWGVALLTVWVVMQAFHLDTVPWTGAALVLVTTNLGMTVPSAPGYVGVYHYIAVLALRVFGVDDSAGLAFAVALHALGFGSFTLAGALLLIVGLARQQYALSDLWRWQERRSSEFQVPSSEPGPKQATQVA
ncbi:MAG: lysylphosphatidylglycerol synthase transmembrane domain-containing protein [Chloroflexota bacterium]